MHDYTGPITMLADMKQMANASSSMSPEVGSAYVHQVYPEWTEITSIVSYRTVGVPESVGLGAILAPDLRDGPGDHRPFGTGGV